MSVTRPMVRQLVLSLVVAMVFVTPVSAQEMVTVNLPSTVTFAVGTSSPVTGTPNPTTISFSNAILIPGRVLRFSVKADASMFSGPGGSSYPATAVSWIVSNASGGSGSNGSLSSSSYAQVFQSNLLASSGGFDIQWRLTTTGGVTYAGTHSLTLRWRLESVQP